MKRPLCVFAVSFFVVQFFALYLPQQVLLPIAAFFLVIFIGSIRFCIKRKFFSIPIIIFACLFALLWRFGYEKLIVKPIVDLNESKSLVIARVDKTSSYSNDVMGAELSVISASDIVPQGFKVYVNVMPQAQVGEYISIYLQFNRLKPSQAYLSSRKIFISADYKGSLEILPKRGALYFFSNIQSYLSNSFRNLTKSDISAVGAAMAFGDKSELSYEIKERFRAAGISHLLVVSGMHLAAASGMAFAIASLCFKSKAIKALISILFTIAFVLLTGITPSAIRAGLMLCILYFGMAFNKQSDSITSLCTALLALTLQNPFIILDMGFLLSFSSTAGIIASKNIVAHYTNNWTFKGSAAILACVKVLAVPAFATLATLPILLYFGVGISLLGVLFNIVAVPLLPIIVAIVFVTAIIGALLPASLIAAVLAYTASFLIKLMLIITSLAALMPNAVLYISSVALAAMIVIVYLIFYIGAKYRIKYFYVYVIAFAFVGIIIINEVQRDIVRVEAIDKTQNSPIVIYNKRQCAVIYRDAFEISKDMLRFLRDNNIKEIDLAVLLSNKNNDDLQEEFMPKEIIILDKIFSTYTITAFDDIMISVKKQNNASAAIIDIQGFKLAVSKGIFNFNAIGAVDIYIAGQSRAENLIAREIIVNNTVPKWLITENIDTRLTLNTKIAIRIGKSYKINEEYYELD